jgi:hypothetical protein
LWWLFVSQQLSHKVKAITDITKDIGIGTKSKTNIGEVITMKLKLENEIRGIIGEKLNYLKAKIQEEMEFLPGIYRRLDRLEALTHADDYKFVTETKLVKIKKEKHENTK